MATRQRDGTRKAVGAPRRNRAKLGADADADTSSPLDERVVSRAVWTLIDLATAWDLATSRGERNQPLPGADKGPEAAFARAVVHIESAARAIRRDFSAYAFSALVDAVAELYRDYQSDRTSESDIRSMLRVIWRRHPAAQLVLANLDEHAFVDTFVKALDAGAKTSAVERVAAVLGLGLESGWSMNRRRPQSVGRPFASATSEATRLRFVLGAVFPDVDTADIADEVLTAVQRRRAKRERIDPRALERIAATTIPWPIDDPSSELESADPDRRFAALGRVIGDTLCVVAAPKDWAHARYGGEVGEVDDKLYREWVRRRVTEGLDGAGEDFIHDDDMSTEDAATNLRETWVASGIIPRRPPT